QLDVVEAIELSQNKVMHIARHAFNLANHTGGDLKVMLNRNQLIGSSFDEEFIKRNNRTNLHLDLSHNAIEELSEAVFKPLLATKKIIIDLTGSKVNCHSAGTAWLFRKENRKLLQKIKGITC